MYQSTRNKNITASSSEAIVRGIAADGGLFMFSSESDIKIDVLSLMGKTTFFMATEILSKLLPDFSKEEMAEIVRKAYSGKFETDELTPTVKIGNEYILELFRGPTSAFKDVALSILPLLLTASAKKNGIDDDIVILTATSGDTGKAALEGFQDVPGTKIIVFYPEEGVSAVQKKQMITQKGNNTLVVAVKGNFDDAQTGVKNIFASFKGKEGVRLSSANSINIGRLAPQVVYYFKAYSDLIEMGDIKFGDKVNFCVPTGNFGDILAGYIAKLMGLPVGKLIVASNANNVLTDFFNTGIYDKRRAFLKTASPSMDILISSNLERLLYLSSGCDNDKTAAYMASLNEKGFYKIEAEQLARLQSEFYAGCLSDEGTAGVIKNTYEKKGYLSDTHTAVGIGVYEEYKAKTGDKTPTVILSTASPYKFSGFVASAIGVEAGDNEFETMRRLEEKTGVPIPKNLKNLEELEVLHKTVISKEEMGDLVSAKASEKVWKR